MMGDHGDRGGVMPVAEETQR
ncbi:hypothetical protein A2U01_0077234, partial [Trifolium medium]|nr:hypothetical protein [Trifolium medium]